MALDSEGQDARDAVLRGFGESAERCKAAWDAVHATRAEIEARQSGESDDES